MRIRHQWVPGDTLSLVEEDIVISALMWHDGNIYATAAALGIGRSTMYKRLKKVGLSTRRDIDNYMSQKRSMAPVVDHQRALGGGAI